MAAEPDDRLALLTGENQLLERDGELWQRAVPAAIGAARTTPRTATGPFAARFSTNSSRCATSSSPAFAAIRWS